ncbi:hypothetical protein PIB30_117043 [Stylosanthes scabra]|uniref:Protein FAR1-RELATED SEQUENCE n=1 Tax=Stylosanthes scabra TaxID=79078 RepID=A0ABU6WT87_9FABA|nr:hypothetical protein [Stylosanthes scabra]
MLRNCMLADVEVDEFEMQWAAMVEDCGVTEDDWVNDLYAKKELWATAYIRGCFYAGLRTTSRCESLHAKLGRFVERRFGVHKFVTNFQRCVDFLRDNEDEMDFRSFYGTPVLETEFPELEKSAATEYTREIFFRFRETLKSIVRISIPHCDEMSDQDIYITQKYMRPRKRWTVAHIKDGDSFECSCKRMESFGLPCVHIIAVLVRLDRDSLPRSVILPRWSKNVRVDKLMEAGGGKELSEESEAIYKTRVGAFLQLCKRFARLACRNDTDYKNFSERVVEDIKLLEQRASSVVGEPADTPDLGGDVADPIPVRTKGTGRGNAPPGSRGVKRRKCSACGELGHRRTRCTSRKEVNDHGTQESFGASASLSQTPRPRRRRQSGAASRDIDGICPSPSVTNSQLPSTP